MVEEEAPLKPSKSEENKQIAPRKVFLRPQVMVQEGDDLCLMAEALFNDSRYGHLIADLNANTINEQLTGNARVIKLTTRQRLSLPVYQDISQFDGSRLREVSNCTLITIVERTEIDRELLEDALSSVLGLNSNNVDPLK